MQSCLHVLIAFACISVGSAGAQESYPTKPIRVIVSNAPGGVTDTIARTVGQRLTDAWGQQVIIENKPGANTQLAAELVARSAPDGYTLLLTPDVTFTINPSLYSKLAYDPARDFTPVSGLVSTTHGLFAHAGLPVQNVRELIALARSRPGELNYATVGIGSAPHLNMEMFQAAAGVKLTAVQYRGSTPALTDLAAGHIPLMFVNIGTAQGAWQAGKVKALAVGAAQRLAQFPDLPTVAESGLAGFEARSWFGLFAPSGTPREVVMKLNAEVQKILAEAAFRDRVLVPNTLEAITASPDDYAAMIRADAQKWANVIGAAKLKAE